MFATLLFVKLKKIDDHFYLWLYHRVLGQRTLHTLLVLTGVISFLLILISVDRQTVAAASAETIRIALAKNEASIQLEGDGLIATGEMTTPLVLASPATITSAHDSFQLNGVSYSRLTVAAAATVSVNGKPFRGRIELRSTDKGILVINELPLEEYLVGLINSEISSAWPIEAVKAQAVIARTYALNRREARKTALYHLESSVLDQVYGGSGTEDSRAERAVTETAGQVLTYQGAIIQAFYHSNCGGKTESAENVWGKSLSYMKGVNCQYCLVNPSSLWEQKLTLKEIEEKVRGAGFKLSTLTDIRTGARNNRGRLATVSLVSSRGNVTMTGDQFRKTIGYGTIKSTNFMVKVTGVEAYFSGYGNGHGVGLCQWGAKQRAVDGFNYTEILSYYYPGTELKHLSDLR